MLVHFGLLLFVIFQISLAVEHKLWCLSVCVGMDDENKKKDKSQVKLVITSLIIG